MSLFVHNLGKESATEEFLVKKMALLNKEKETQGQEGGGGETESQRSEQTRLGNTKYECNIENFSKLFDNIQIEICCKSRPLVCLTYTTCYQI